jgi:hypothetical protein
MHLKHVTAETMLTGLLDVTHETKGLYVKDKKYYNEYEGGLGVKFSPAICFFFLTILSKRQEK